MKHRLAMLSLTICLAACGKYGGPLPPKHSSQRGKESVTSLSFSSIKSQILDKHCISCHTGRHSAYENYEVVKSSASDMLFRMETSNPLRRMPKDAVPLDTQSIALFRQWVQAGAPENGSQQNENPKPNPIDPLLGFSDVKDRVLEPYRCVDCHSQLNSYRSVKRSLSSITSLILNNQMPFPKTKSEVATPLSSEDKDLLLRWVAQGAPELPGQPEGDLPEPVLQPTFLSLRDNVFGPKCILCHNSYGNRGAGLNLGSFRDIREAMATNPDLIKLDSPNDSHLIGAILGRVDDDEFFFDAMPFNNDFDDVQEDVESVTEEELQVILKWIELNLPYSEDEL